MPGTQHQAAGSLLVLVRCLRAGVWMRLACAERQLQFSAFCSLGRLGRRGLLVQPRMTVQRGDPKRPATPRSWVGRSFVPSSHKVLSCSKIAFGNSIIHSFNQQAFTEFRLKRLGTHAPLWVAQTGAGLGSWTRESYSLVFKTCSEMVMWHDPALPLDEASEGIFSQQGSIFGETLVGNWCPWGIAGVGGGAGAPTGLPSKRGPGLGSFSRADRGIGG